MAFEEIKAEIALLVARLAEHPHDRLELEHMLHAKLEALRASGLPLPEDLVALEAALDRQLSGDARRRTKHSKKLIRRAEY